MSHDWPTTLRSSGLRVTAGRLAVLAELETNPHSGITALTEALRSRLGSVSTQAVYDVLAALQDAQLIRRVEPAGQQPRFELQTGDNHHHLMCRGCGSVSDVACAIGHAPCLSPSAAGGFAVDEAEVIYWGLCANCTKLSEENA